MIRAARLTDRQALADLSARVHASEDAHRRSLGVPAPLAGPGRVSLSTLIPSWVPLRAPSLHLVYEDEGELVGSCRAIEEPGRDDWVITELDAADGPMAAEIRYDLLSAACEEGIRRGVARYHAACADVRENLELFRQLSFMAYAQETILYREPVEQRSRGGLRGRLPWPRAAASGQEVDLRPAGAPDAWHVFDLWTHATPPAIARVEGYDAADWESVGHEAVVPRSSLAPLLHFGEVNAWLLEQDGRAALFVQHAECKEGPHYVRFLLRDGTDAAARLAGALERLGPGAASAGVLAPVRTYEAMGFHAARDAGFEPIGRVTLLVREVRAAIRQPAMVPAID
jgi:hypothetical protein